MYVYPAATWHTVEQQAEGANSKHLTCSAILLTQKVISMKMPETTFKMISSSVSTHKIIYPETL